MILHQYWVTQSNAGDVLMLEYNNYHRRSVRLNQNSGTIWGCEKPIVYPLSVTHTGIYLGTCTQTGEHLFIHSHPRHGKAVIGNKQDFCQDRPMWVEETACTNSPAQVLGIGLQHVAQQTAYSVLYSNCQHLTSQACNNQAKSKDLQAVGSVVAGVGLLSLFLWATTRKAS